MRTACAALVAAAFSSSALAAALPLEDYGKLPAVEQMVLSPSGKQIATVAVIGEKRRIIAMSTDGEPRLAVPVGTAKVRDVSWAGEDRLLIANSQMVNLPFVFAARYELGTRVAVDLNAKNGLSIFGKRRDIYPAIMGDYGVREIDGKAYGFFGAITLVQGAGGDYFLEHTFPDLYRVALDTGDADRIAQGSELSHDWVLDPQGKILARSEYDRQSGQWRLNAGDFGGKRLMTRKSPLDQIDVKGLGRTPDTLLVSDDTGDRTVIEEQPLDGGAPTPLLQDVTVEQFLYAAKSRLLLGATVEGPQGAVLFDPHLQARFNGTRNAMPGLQVRLVSYTDDFGRLIIFTDGGDDSGTYWLVDIATGKANNVGAAYPSITEKEVGPTRLIHYKAADGLELDGVLTLPPHREARNLPVVMMPHGGPIGPYDSVGFDWWAQAFASRGYAVFQPNYRGSGGHGRPLIDAGYGEFGRKMQSDVSDGLAAIAAQGLVDPKRACIVGGSYGGYAALAGVTLQHGLYRCAVSYGGVTDLGDLLSDRAQRAGDHSDTVRFWRAAMGVKNGADPQLDRLSPTNNADKADAPILLIAGKEDTVVPPGQTNKMASALKRAGKPYEVVTLEGEDHWLSREDTRISTLKASVAFVEKHNPAG